VYGGQGYIDPNYEPEEDFVTVLWIKGREKLERLAEGIAAESSVGTWTGVKTANERVWELRGRIFRLVKSSPTSGFVFVAYPVEHFDHDNLLQLMASIRGNIFGMKALDELYLLDWSIPERYQKKFEGPVHGIEGIRGYLGTEKSRRPHVGTIVKPKVGLTPEEFAKVAYECFSNGLDLVKDDENLVNQDFCPWQERVLKVVEAAEKAEEETGEKKIYVPNITDFLPRMMERIDFLVEHGWKMAMVDVYVIGVAGLKEVLDELHRKKFIVHAHRAGYAAEHRGRFGVSFAFWEKIYRLLGVDQLHVGTGVGKMEGSPVFIRKYAEILRREEIEGFEPVFLKMRWCKKIKPVLPVASGGLHPGLVEAVIAVHGTTDLVVQAGGGVHGHPGGSGAGARAMREAVELATAGESVSGKKVTRELKEAIEKWRYVPASKVHELFERFEMEKEKWVERIAREGFDAIEKINREVVVS